MTLKRVRAYCTLMAATLWVVWAANFSVPGAVDRLGKAKATDFLQFYVGGSFVREGRTGSLYDVQALFARAKAIAPGARDTLYMPVQSPQTALAFVPLSVFPYPAAAGLWIAIIVLLYAAAGGMTWWYCPSLRSFRYEAVVGALAFPGLYSTVLFGQTSAVSLFAIALALLALRRGWSFRAGLAIGCLAFKPHWLAAAGAVFIVAREWRVAAGAFAGAAAQIAFTTFVLGRPVMIAYAQSLQRVQRLGDLLEPYPGDSLRSFFKVFVPSAPGALIAYLAASLVTVYVAGKVWRSDASFELRSSCLILAMLLISPHAFPYDLILLAPVYFMLADWLAGHQSHPMSRPISLTLCVLFVAPLLSVVPAPLRLQCSVTAMAVLLFVVSRVADARDSVQRTPALAPSRV